MKGTTTAKYLPYPRLDRSGSILAMVLMLMLVSFLTTATQASAFVQVVNCPPKLETKASVSTLCEHRNQSTICTTPENDALYTELYEEIESAAKELWDGAEMPRTASTDETTTTPCGDKHNPQPRVSIVPCEGEARLPEDVPFSERADYFRNEALKGCPNAQHSYGLLLWSGFAGTERNPEESAKFHAAAACQHHLDGMAVFGGCLRTGTGMPKKKKQKKTKKPAQSKRKTNTVALGLKLIDFCASVGNPTGVNKQAALLESNGNDSGAVELYEGCLESGRANALLFFNLGWCLVNGRGVDRKDRDKGISLWKAAAEMAPDEGSEEAAWNLYEEYARDEPQESEHWRKVAEELGYRE